MPPPPFCTCAPPPFWNLKKKWCLIPPGCYLPPPPDVDGAPEKKCRSPPPPPLLKFLDPPLPQGGIFIRSTCQSNTHAHKAVIIPSIDTTGILHFPTLSISRCRWIYLAQGEFFENVLKITRSGKTKFGVHNYFVLPYMISRFRVQSWFEMFFIRYNRELLLYSSFWENATVTTRPCNN